MTHRRLASGFRLGSLALAFAWVTAGIDPIVAASNRALQLREPVVIGEGPGPTPRPVSRPLPDLAIESLILGAGNSLRVVLENNGNADLESDAGALSVFVDGALVLEAALATLPDPSFRDAGGSAELDTGIVLYGQDRLLTVVVDPHDEIEELNEYQNSRSVTLNAWEFGQSDLEPALQIDPEGNVTVDVRNRANGGSPAGLEAELEILVDGVVAYTESLTLPAIAGGSFVTVEPDGGLQLDTPTPIEARLDYVAPYVDGDSTNDSDRSILPAPSLEKYDYLFNDAAIAARLVFKDPGGTYYGYNNWPQFVKDELAARLVALEQGRGMEGAQVPATFEYLYHDLDDGRAIYLNHVSQAFWVDANDVVPWKLQDMSIDELSESLDLRAILYLHTDKYSFSDATINWNPRAIYHFLDNRGLIRQTKEHTVIALARYLRAHLLHHFGADPPEQKWGYSTNFPPVERVLFPIPGQKHWTAGCWGTARLFKAALRSINIRSELKISVLATPAGAGSHASPWFPELELLIVHGDDLYNATTTPWVGFVGTPHFFFIGSQIETLIENPVPQCNSVGVCNTEAEQRSYNHGRHFLLEAAQALPGHYLKTLCNEGQQGLDEYLRGVHVGGDVLEYAYPYLGDVERADFQAAARLKLYDLGGGDVDAGCSWVGVRSTVAGSLRTPVTSGLNSMPYFPDEVGSGLRTTTGGQFLTFAMPATDPDGGQLSFVADGLPSGAVYTMLGDVDGDGRLRSADVTIVQDFVNGTGTLTQSERVRADADRDGSLTQWDADRIAVAVQGVDPLNTGVFTWESAVEGVYVATFAVTDGSYAYPLKLQLTVWP